LLAIILVFSWIKNWEEKEEEEIEKDSDCEIYKD